MLYSPMLRSILIMTTLASSSSVMGKEISYDYIQGGFINTLGSDPVPDGEGFEFSGSFSVMSNIAITAGYERTDFDERSGIDVDTATYDLGVTAHNSTIAPGASLFVNLSVLGGEVEASDGAYKYDTGYAVSVGLRSMVTDIIEIETALSREDLFDDHDALFVFAGRVYTSEKLSFGAGYVVSRNAESLEFNARVNF